MNKQKNRLDLASYIMCWVVTITGINLGGYAFTQVGMDYALSIFLMSLTFCGIMAYAFRKRGI